MAEEKPNWMKTKPAELDKIIIDLGKKGETPAKIGLILRDKHGIPKASLLDRKITDVLKEAGIEYKKDVVIIKEKIDNLKKHITSNKHDHSAERSLTKQMWAVRKMEKEQQN